MIAPWVAQLSPNQAVFLLTAGVALIFVECNRPGAILPGALGVLGVLLAFAALLRRGLPFHAAVLLAASAALLAVPLRLRRSAASAALGALGLVWGLHAAAPGVGWAVATLCGGSLALASIRLADAARRAREAKRLTRQSR